VRAASRAGHRVQRAYCDGTGRMRRCPMDAFAKIVAAASDGAGPEAVTVAWAGALRVPWSGGEATCTLRLEDGSVRTWTTPAAGGEIHAGALPSGVHRLRIEGAGEAREMHVVAAPVQAPAPGPRGWGVYVPLYALRTVEGLGVADLGDLERLLDGVHARGGVAVAVLPLLAAFLGDPYDPSPYAPVSRRFWNELYLDVDAEPEARDPDVAALVASTDVQEEAARVRAMDHLDHRAAYRLKRRVLDAMAAAARRDPERRAALRAWLDADPEAEAYARFRAAVEAGQRPQPGEELPDGGEAAWTHAYAQWVMDRRLAQLSDKARRRGQRLVMDMPLGIHPLGFDALRHAGAFAKGVCVGAPPDAFFERGQSWGFPPLHPLASARDGHAALRHALATQARHAGLLRIDHVMGLHRVFWVPDGRPATDGAYVRSPTDAWYALAVLEAHRAGTALWGEDLGTVPKEVPRRLARHGILGTQVLQIEASFGPLRPPGRPVVASLNTHDMPPFAEFWRAAPEEVRRRWPGRPDAEAGDALDAALDWLGASDAPLVLVNLEDLWLEDRPQNRPGTTAPTNWSRRTRIPLDAMLDDPVVGRRLRRLDAACRRGARAGGPDAMAASRPWAAPAIGVRGSAAPGGGGLGEDG